MITYPKNLINLPFYFYLRFVQFSRYISKNSEFGIRNSELSSFFLFVIFSLFNFGWIRIFFLEALYRYTCERKKFEFAKIWWAQVDSNHRPHAYQACALTTWAMSPFSYLAVSLFPFRHFYSFSRVGGDERDRTDDPLLAKQVLSQLSYTPKYLLKVLWTFKIKQRSNSSLLSWPWMLNQLCSKLIKSP